MAPVQLQWIKAHVGHVGNEAADHAAKAALSRQPLGPPLNSNQSHLSLHVDGKLIGADWCDAISLQLAHTCLNYHATHHHSQGQWASTVLNSSNSWSAAGAPHPADHPFSIKARGHALPSAHYFCRHCEGPNVCDLYTHYYTTTSSATASTVLPVVDSSTHWYSCPVMQPAWVEAERQVGHSLSMPLALQPAHREPLTWGLVPHHLPSPDGHPWSLNTHLKHQFVLQWTAAAHNVWCQRTNIWQDLHKQGLASLAPADRLTSNWTAKQSAANKAHLQELEEALNLNPFWSWVAPTQSSS